MKIKIKYIVDQGADINKVDEKDSTALIIIAFDFWNKNIYN